MSYGETDYIDAFNKANDTAVAIMKAIEEVLLELIRQGDPKHGELTVAKAIVGGEDTSIVLFDPRGLPSSAQTALSHTCDLMQKDMCDKDNGVGQVCHIKVDLDDGRYALMFRSIDNDRVRALLSNKDFNLSIETIAASKFEMPDNLRSQVDPLRDHGHNKKTTEKER